MKRLLLAVCSAFILLVGVTPAHAANLQNFRISNYDIDYELSRDEDNRSVLKTTETITAQFPNTNQNHGIERAIPKSYDGHSVSLDIESVKKSDGSDWPYEARSENGNEILRIGDADEYVRGEQVFVIEYTVKDVTKTFSNTGDEFYWDTNGNDWAVTIENLNVTLTINDGLVSALNNQVACYQGQKGSDDPCGLERTANTYTVNASNLTSGQNVTVAIGFKKGTFGQYQQSVSDKFISVYGTVLIATSIVAVGVAIWLFFRADKWSERRHERGTIIAEYTPPKDASLTTSASLLTAQGSVFSAQLLDFAVRGYVKLYQTREAAFLKSAEYDIEITKNISALKDEEQEILKDIFDQTVVGSRLKLKTLKNNTGIYKRTLDNDKKLKALVRGEYGLRHNDEGKRKWFKKAGFILLGLAVLLLSPGLLIAAVIAFALAATLWPLTDKGLELSRYLEGLKDYIKVAEVDRIKMLQSPEGAEKIGGIDVKDEAQLVKLYEKVLPYAVLFGQEKEWTKRLGDIYDANGSSPVWYASSNGMFNAALFSSAVSGFSTAASYSSASSSSSGGSSGGGSSGGGGGGGGGGGW